MSGKPTIQNVLDNLKDVLDNLKDVRADIRDVREDTQDLRKDNQGLHKGFQDLSKDNQSLHKGFEELHKDNQSLHKGFEELRKDNQSLHENIQDVIEVIGEFSKNVDQRFDHLEGDVNVLKQDVRVIKNTMASKDYMEEKIADLRGDLVTLSRKGNRKFEAAIHELVLEGNLKPSAAKEILSLEPFPSLG
jgi:predicted nuclease with TOPRIM domain